MKVKPNVAISESGFVFDANSGESYSLNPIGIEILNELKQNKSRDDIFTLLMKKYEVAEYTLEQNLLDFMTLLKQYNLIEEII
jgi:hypothetical protein